MRGSVKLRTTNSLSKSFSSNKFPTLKTFRFGELSFCAQQCNDFLELYTGLPRNSALCQELWLQVVRSRAIFVFVERQIKQNFSLFEPQLYPQLFIEQRQIEVKEYLKFLKPALIEAHQFVYNFIQIRKPFQKQDFGENVKVAKRMEKHLKKHPVQLENLINQVDRYEEFISALLRSSGEKTVFQEFVKSSIKEKKLVKESTAGTLRLVTDLKNRLRVVDDQVDWNRIDVLIASLDDANRAIGSSKVAKALLKARERVRTRAKSKKRTIFSMRLTKSPVTETESVGVPGVQQLGPFGIKPMSEFFLDHFDFTNCSNSKQFEIDLTQFLPPGPEEKKFMGKISPLSAVMGKTESMKTAEKIPEKAKCLCFAYPNEHVNAEDISLPETVNDQQEDFETLKSFLKVGGFLFFDENHKFLQLNVMVENETDIYLKGPFVVPQKRNKKLLENLSAKEEWVDVKIESLKEQGATQFCWLPAGKFQTANGCFVFMHGDKKKTISYFEFADVHGFNLFRSVRESARSGGNDGSFPFLNNISVKVI